MVADLAQAQDHPHAADALVSTSTTRALSEARRDRSGRRERVYQAIASGMAEQLARAGVPGGALAIVEGNRLRFATGVGVKQAGGSEPVDADSLFRIGSITKTFTAALAVQLASEHVVSLDVPITRYVPELQLQAPHDPRRISLRMLLSHTSGIPEYTEFECSTEEGALAAWFADHPNLTLWTPPGRLFSYSNLGYSLAGLVLERAAGAPYAQLVEELVLEPLGLDAMTYDVAEANAGNHASGFSPEFELDPTTMACALCEPPGFLWSSARDLARFASTLLRGGDHVLDARGLKQMQAPQAIMDPSGRNAYGLGLVSTMVRGVRVVYHDGGMPGYHAAMWLVPERDAAVVVLLNGDNAEPNALAAAALAELLDLPPQQPVDGATPPSAWVDYLGVYDEGQPETAFPEPWIGALHVDLEGEQLFLRDAEDSERILLEQIAGDVWLAHVEDDFVIPITFWRDRRGRVEYIASRWGALHRIGNLP
jgi:CubicO group peptidase (beta-lactamase class C family)